MTDMYFVGSKVFVIECVGINLCILDGSKPTNLQMNS